MTKPAGKITSLTIDGKEFNYTKNSARIVTNGILKLHIFEKDFEFHYNPKLPIEEINETLQLSVREICEHCFPWQKNVPYIEVSKGDQND